MALPKEEATARLDALHVESWLDDREARLKRLPRKLRTPALRMFGDPADPSVAVRDYELTEFISMPPKHRTRIFEAAFPGLGESVERAWQFHLTLPYRSGWSRRPFRVADRPERSLGRQAQFVRRSANVLGAYHQNVAWHAAWSSYLSADLGYLFAAEIDSGPEGEAVLQTLLDTVNGSHPVGMVGRGVIRGLVSCARAEAWEAVESLLLAAQRQEGLRSVIFETADEGHPDAFRRILRLAVEEDLTRFASVTRAFDVWLGLGLDVTSKSRVRSLMTLLASAVESRAATVEAVASDDPEEVYCGLWSWAVNDASGASTAAGGVLARTNPEHRFVAVHLLDQLRLPESAQHLIGALDDSDERVAWRAFEGLQYAIPVDGRFEALEGYLNRLTGDRELEPLVWDWHEASVSRSQVVRVMLGYLRDRHPTVLEPYLPLMDANTRAAFARAVADAPPTADRRRVLLGLATDRSEFVTRVAFEALAESRLDEQEAGVIEGLLTRSRGSTRSAAVTLLLAQPEDQALQSAERLLASGKKPVRLGGLDLLRQLADAGRGGARPARLATGYAASRKLGTDEEPLVEAIRQADEEPPTLDDGLGLFDPDALAPTVVPRKQPLAVGTRSMGELLTAADEFATAYKEVPVTVTRWSGIQEELYGNLRYLSWPQPGQAPEEEILHAEWADWWARQRPARFDLERALVSGWAGDLRAHPELIHGRLALKHAPQPPGSLGNPRQVYVALWWRWIRQAGPASITFLLDGLEGALAAVPKEHLAQPVLSLGTPPYVREVDWRGASMLLAWKHALDRALWLRPDLFDDATVMRLWGLQAWIDRPSPSAERFRPEFPLLMQARRLGAASDADVLDHLIGPRPAAGRSWYGYRRQFHSLGESTRRRPVEAVADTPGLLDLADTARRRIIEVELSRGDVATAASFPGLAVRSVPGAATTLRLIDALGRGTLQRGWSWNPQEKNGVLSHLIRVSLPSDGDTPNSFARLVAEHGTKERRLLELAMYAPQWSRHVEHTIGWAGLDDAVHWIHAHTKDSRWSVDADIRELWAAETAERTPLTATDLIDGAVDVAWFHRVFATLGEERWTALLEYAKFASGGGGHKRAEVFAQALIGSLYADAITTRISEKRHQDSVRALGLVPLPADDDARQAAVLERYQRLQEFLRTSKKFGSQRQTSEKRAVEVAMLNLARTAGYADPQRLQWAMEIEETADLASGSIVVTRDEYEFELSIDELGTAAFRTRKNGKALKSIPAKHRKDEQIVELRERAKTLRRQVSRMRSTLESASIRGDQFTGIELVRLHDHPVLRPMLANVVFATDNGSLGFPEANGTALGGLDGVAEPVSGGVRIAHATDLLASDNWIEWQRRCFEEERTQPFKQIFRELYIPTAAELDDGKKSSQFSGHQVNPQQAAGVFGSRGWVLHPDEGPAKTFHDVGLTARVTMMGGWFTPAEVDGMTIEHVFFSHRGQWDFVPFEDVPRRIFSEVMRDVDLIVSVAHIGGVDPEASASTVEMRRALVRETATLLDYENVRFANHHVIIDGTLGSYSVHLGSGTVHRQPGGALFIVPVGSQHRGRLFLPFADDDPKTAEVVSKTVMLARDDQIKDPTILEQLV